jgi:hypothetical protein
VEYNLINIGRGKFNGRVNVDSEAQLLRECKKHLTSNGVDIEWQDEDCTIGIVTAGLHSVGHVQAVEG